MVNLVNLTPHEITLQAHDGQRHIIPPSGTVARVASVPGELREIPGVPVPVADPTTFGKVENLPDPQSGTFFIVSAMVASALDGSRSDDVLVPGTGPRDGAIRGPDGRIEAVTRLVRS